MKTKHTLLAGLFAVAGTAALAQPMPPTHPEDHGHERAERMERERHMERRDEHRDLRAEHRNIRRDREALKLREHEARECAHEGHEDMEHR